MVHSTWHFVDHCAQEQLGAEDRRPAALWEAIEFLVVDTGQLVSQALA